MKKRKMCRIALALVSLFLTAALCACGSSKTELKLGSGNEGGTYYAYANQLKDLVKNDIQIEVKTTAGSAANIRLIEENFMDIAMAQSDILRDSADTNSGYSAVAALYTETVQIVVRADSGIETIEDMKGKKVSLGEEESGVLTNATQILMAYGMTADSVEAKYLSFNDSADAMRNGEIDAFFCTAGAPTTAITELGKDVEINLISLGEEEIEKMEQLYGGYVSVTIPSGTYQGQDEDVAALAVKAVLIARNNLDTDTVKTLTGLIMQYAEELQGNTVTDEALTPASATEGVTIPFHPGAAAYYEENGITVTEASEDGNGNVSAGQDE